ncbi:MAG TPA: hypothetical protein VII63_06645 [Caulobacteraceae bacterium]
MRAACLLVTMALGSLAWSAGAATGDGATMAGPRIHSERAVPSANPIAGQAGHPPASAAPRSPYRSFASGPTFNEAHACRQVCAEALYFCAVGPAADHCPGSWSQCAATCESTDFTGSLPAAAP